MELYKNKMVIYDRGVYGCYMYQDVIAQHQIPLEDILAYAREFTKRGNMIWWVDAPIGEISKRLKERGDKHIDQRDLETINGRYHQLFKHFEINKIPFLKITSP